MRVIFLLSLLFTVLFSFSSPFPPFSRLLLLAVFSSFFFSSLCLPFFFIFFSFLESTTSEIQLGGLAGAEGRCELL